MCNRASRLQLQRRNVALATSKASAPQDTNGRACDQELLELCSLGTLRADHDKGDATRRTGYASAAAPPVVHSKITLWLVPITFWLLTNDILYGLTEVQGPIILLRCLSLIGFLMQMIKSLKFYTAHTPMRHAAECSSTAF